MERVVWIPFEAPYSYEFFERTLSWIKERPQKNFRILTYDPNRPTHIAHPALLNLVWGSQIYLRGHGLAGDAHVTTTYNNGKQKLHIHDSIDRLLDMGLPSTFRGTIKFYSCFSALTGVPKYLGGGTPVFDKKHPEDILKTKMKGGNYAPKGIPLAKVGANYFRSKGFNKCKFLGYKGPLTGAYVDSDNAKDNQMHKYCEEVKYDCYGTAHFQPTKSRRASDARASF